jgi:ABC-type lipoprotein release transport system permease subunit
MRKIIFYSWKEIRRSKARSVTAIVGYSLAALFFGILISLQVYSDKSLHNILSNTGTHFISYKPLCCGLPYIDNNEEERNFIANGISTQPLPLSLINDIKKIPEVLDASPYLLYKLKDEKNGNNFLIAGFDINDSIAVKNSGCSSNDVISGRFLNHKDTSTVILELSYASSNGFKINSLILIGGVKMKIVGIINSGIRPAKADVYMLYKTAEKVIGNDLNTPIEGMMNIVLVESANAYLHSTAIKKVNRILGNSSLTSSYNCYKPASGAMDISKKLLNLIFILTIILIILFSLYYWYSSIISRQNDLGILAAIGWNNFEIMKLMFIESIIQISAGGIIGLIFFTIFIYVVPLQEILGTAVLLEKIIYIELYILGFSIVLFASIIGGFFPIISITKKIPLENLRVLY